MTEGRQIVSTDEGFILTNRGQMAPEEIVDYLTYSSYRYNRQISPETTPEQWARIFGPKTQAMERRYQQELFDAGKREEGTIDPISSLKFSWDLPLKIPMKFKMGDRVVVKNAHWIDPAWVGRRGLVIGYRKTEKTVSYQGRRETWVIGIYKVRGTSPSVRDWVQEFESNMLEGVPDTTASLKLGWQHPSIATGDKVVVKSKSIGIPLPPNHFDPTVPREVQHILYPGGDDYRIFKSQCIDCNRQWVEGEPVYVVAGMHFLSRDLEPI